MAPTRIRPINGMWWLPGCQHRLAGRLTFIPSRGRLWFSTGISTDLPPMAWTRPALYGESRTGKQLTLLDPTWLDRPPPIDGWTPPPTTRTAVTSQVLLRGIHIESADNFRVGRATIRLQGLKELCARRYGFYGRTLVAFVGGDDDDPRSVRIDVDDGRLTFVRRRVRVAGTDRRRCGRHSGTRLAPAFRAIQPRLARPPSGADHFRGPRLHNDRSAHRQTR